MSRPLAAVLAASLFSLAACSKSTPTTPPPADEYVVDCEAGDGGIPTASDENYASFLNADAAGTTKQDGCKSPELTAPVSGTSLLAITPPTFSFHTTHASCLRTRPAGATQQHACRSYPAGTPGDLSRLLGAASSLLIGTAQAHCAAFTGENYLLRLSHSGESKPVFTAVLSVTDYTPDANLWKTALSGRGGQTLTLTLERAVFLRGDINDGPYTQPQPYTFTVVQ